MDRKFLQPVITKSQPVITNLKTGHHFGALWTESKWHTFLTISDIFFKTLCVLTIDLHLHLLYRKCTIQFALKAPPIICMSRREMNDEGLPWCSLKRKSDKYAKNGEEMMDILVDDIDRYEQLSNREELLALASALAGNGAVLEVVHTLDPIDPVDVTGIP